MTRLLLTVLLLLGAPALARAGMELSIPAEASVETAHITLGQIANLEALPEELATRLEHLPLGAAAGPARHRSFTGIFLQQLVAKTAPEVRVEAPEQVRVHTAYRDITPEYVRARVEQALAHRLPWEPESLQITGWKLPAAFAVPARHRRLRVHFREGEDFLGRLSAELEFSNAHDPEAASIRRTVTAELIVKLPVVVAVGKLRRGAILGPENIRVEVLDLRQQPRDVLQDPQAVLGSRLVRAVPEGTPLLRAHLQSDPVVRRGETVRVRANDGGLDLYIEARALEKGAPGERIRLENPGTRRRFFAEIIGPGLARLTQPGVGSR